MACVSGDEASVQRAGGLDCKAHPLDFPCLSTLYALHLDLGASNRFVCLGFVSINRSAVDFYAKASHSGFTAFYSMFSCDLEQR